MQVTNLTVVATGLVTFTNAFSNGAVRLVTASVPTDLPDWAEIVFTVTARDFRGLASAPVAVAIPLFARPLPQLAILTNVVEVPETLVSNLVVSATHADGGLARLELVGTNFAALSWTNNGATRLDFLPAVAATNAVFQVALPGV